LAGIFKKVGCPSESDLELALDDDKMNALREEIIDSLEGRTTDENSLEKSSRYMKLVNTKFHALACGKCMKFGKTGLENFLK
jgi:hypothetical protein